jgi:hypothetical protein
MASSYSDLGIELMATGENAGTWGTKTNTNLQIVEKAIAGYVEQAVTSGGTTALSITDGDATESTSVARHAVIKLTGTITGNSIVTVPDSIEKVYIVTNGTSGAYTVQFKTASGTGITFGVSEKTTRLVYSDGTNLVDAGFGGSLDLEGRELVLDADGDTTITADTDDQIDIKIAGADDFQFTANTFTAQSGSSIVVPESGLTFGSTAITSTAAELNLLDGVSGLIQADFTKLAAVDSTAAELNIVDGGTSATSTTVADADRVVLNDNGTMVQVAVTDLAAYFDDEITAMPNLVTTAATTVGALNSGSITSGFGTIDTGSSTITTTGLISGGSLDIDDVLINGTTIGHTDDTDLLTVASGLLTVAGEVSMTTLDIGGTNVTSTAAELNLVDGITAGTVSASLAVIADSNKDISGFRNVTLTGELDAATGDFSGDVDIDGTLEADAITVDGTTLAEFISDTTGAMFSSNTETGITVTYQDSDNTIDLALAAAQTTITSLLATDIKIGEDDQTKIDFETADEIHFYAANVEQVYVGDNIFGPQSDSDVDLGSTGVRWKDAFVDSLTTTGDLTIGGNFTVNGTTTTVATTNMVVSDNLIELNNGASSNSNDSGIVIERGSTGDNAIFVWDESADTFLLGTTTATGSSTGNLTITDGALQAGSLDISGNVDVDGTLETDALSIASTAITSTAAEINLIDGGATVGTTAVADGDGILHNDGGTMKVTSAATFKTYFTSGVSSAADDLTAGDAAVNITTSSGNITIDAAANDSDVIFKGTDDSADITMLTLDGSDAGSATFNDKIIVGDGKLVLNSTAVTSTAAELNLLDGVSGLVQADLTKLAAVDSTAAELNIVDGGTSATSTTVADADRVVLNDNGTMVQVAMTDIKTYIGGGTSWQAVKTSNFTAAAGQGVFCNTSGGAFTLTLPAGTIGDEVSFIDYAGTFDSNNLTIASNGSEKIHGSTDNLTVAVERASNTLVFTDSTQGWLFKSK